MQNLPPATQRLYAEKGRADLLLKQLARTGRRRFATDPTTAAKFSLSILNRKGAPRNTGRTGPSE